MTTTNMSADKSLNMRVTNDEMMITFPESPQQEHQYQKFEFNDPIAVIDNRPIMNPKYYEDTVKHGQKFDLRQVANRTVGGQKSNYLMSAFWNPKTHMILKKTSEESYTNIYTNKLSFAKKYGR